MSLLSEDSSEGSLYEYGGTACKNVGKYSTCIIVAPDNFDFGTDTSGDFYWKGGRFHLPYPVGDVNHNGMVSISDVMMVVGYLSGYEWLENCDRYTADVNGDQLVTVSDVMSIVGIIIGQ